MSANKSIPKRAVRRELAEAERLEPDFLVTRAGGKEEPHVSEKISRQEDVFFGVARPQRIELPDWFRSLARRRAAPDEVIGTLRERLSEIPDLRQAQVLLNEVGRLDGAGEAIKQVLTQDVVSRLHELHRKKG
jgi:hypothetical protein